MKRPWMWKQAVKQRHPIVSSNSKARKIIQPGIQSQDTSHCRKSTKAWHCDSFKLKPCREFIPWVLPPHPFQPGIQPGMHPTTDSLPRHGGGTFKLKPGMEFVPWALPPHSYEEQGMKCANGGGVRPRGVLRAQLDPGRIFSRDFFFCPASIGGDAR